MREASRSAGIDGEHEDSELDPAPPESSDAAYRGFLFADLRGFTAFVDSHGELAGADLLDAYRVIVREQVAAHVGAEIRTEGDSFYVVFPSARTAVACGLAIVAAARRYSADHPDRPIRVGIGVNAGETIQRREGFVGTAVNLAARVCGKARAGEVLVTPTVREAVRGTHGLRFVARGSHRLKGLAESVPLYAVEPTLDQPPAGATRRTFPVHGRRRTTAFAAGLIAAAVVVFAVIAAGLWPDGTAEVARRDGTAGTAPPSDPAAASRPDPASAAPSPDPSPDTYPSADETALLALVGDGAEECARADLDDRPRFIKAEDPGFRIRYGPNPPVEVSAGLSCVISSVTAPTTLRYWLTAPMLDYTAVNMPKVLILNHAGAFEVPSGDCSASDVAHGRWAFGGSEGWLLCREVYGDAVLMWSYDGQPVLAVATRRDGDHAALVTWWRDNARFAGQ